MKVSLKRFESYFQWTTDKDEDSGSDSCDDFYMDRSDATQKNVADPGISDDAYKKFKERNAYDFEIYDYTQIIFDEQGSLFE